MTDPKQTGTIPSDDQQVTQTPIQEGDFFGGGEEDFHKAVLNPNDGSVSQVEPTHAASPETTTREPTLPAEAPESSEAVSPEQPTTEGQEHQEEETSVEFEPNIDGESTPPPWTPEPVTSPILEAEDKSPSVQETPTSQTDQEDKGVPKDTDKAVADHTEVPNKELSDLGKKFMTLVHLCKHVQDWKKSQEGFSLLGADNEKIRVLYTFVIGDPAFPMVSVIKKEKHKTQENKEETIHELSFYLNESGTSVNINLNEDLLLEEDVDLQDDMKKKMQVMEKINKFIFLVTEESKKIEREVKENEAELEEKRKLQDIFRNF